MAGRPVPKRRKDLPGVDTSAKMELVNSFVGFNTTTVTDHHIQLARKCTELMPSRSTRYDHVPFHMILQWNQDKLNYPSMIAQACDLLLKYVVNLLKPKRPQVWRSIKTTNSHFCARVDCMVGAREILSDIGYSEEQDNSAIQFPDYVKEPDKEKLHVIAAELLMAKLEAEGLQGKAMTRQLSSTGSESSISRQESNPGTPSNSQLQSTHGPSHDNHLTPAASHTGPVEFKTALLYTEPTMNNSPPVGRDPTASQGISPASHIPNTSSGEMKYSALANICISPTERFTPHPSLVGPYETAVPQPTMPRDIPRAPQTLLDPPVSKTPAASDHSSLGSSGDSNYETPPSTSPPAATAETSTCAADLNRRLEKLRLEREKIHNQLNRKVTTVGTLISTQAPTRGIDTTTTTASTSVHALRAPLVNDLKASSGATRKKPPPRFNHDTIPEEGPSNGNGLENNPLPTGPPPVSNSNPPAVASLPSGTSCSSCGHIVTVGQTRCGYCSHPVQPATSSFLPPPIHTETGLVRMSSGEPKSKPLRASVARAEEAAQGHRRTRAIPLEGQNPPGAVGPSAHVSTVGSDGQGGAEGTSGGATGVDDRSYKDIAAEKLEVWKEEWRKRGYTDDEIPLEPGSQPLPDAKPLPPQERQKKPPVRKKVKVRSKDYNPGKSTTDELERYQREEVRRKEMEKMAQEGETFMKCVKLCVQHSYALEEVQLAYRKCRQGHKEIEVLKYLQQDWANSVREVQQYVVGLVDKEGRTVGYPSELESRKHLVLANGNVMVASHKLYYERKKKIEELQLKFKPYCELEWRSAELALSAFDMNLEKAACSIQCEALQPLYEFIFSEWTQVPATDMQNIKKRLKSEKDETGREANMRMLMGEYRLETTAKAAMVLDLMNKVEGGDADYPLSYYVDAAKDYSTLEEAERGLIKECPLCGDDNMPVHEMITMPGCTDTMCKSCFKQNFTIVIKERGVKHFNCPTCSEPDMTNRDGAQDLYQELFVQMLHEHVPELYDLAQAKLTELNLQKDPGFRWCANEKCVSCFINPNLERKKIQCPTCDGLMCFQCKKPWEDQHNGLTCEAFADWKRQNDPKFQKEGLAAHLAANGIECPDCHMRYELARGGCMHFKCTRCPNEFCSGCGGSFKKAQVCGRFQSCVNRGLHAHHPRDCLYFMRDFTVEDLQAFLRENNVEFETQPAPVQLEAAREEAGAEEGEDEPVNDADGKEVVLKCSAMLQKELVDKLMDEACGDEVKDGHAGLCEKHYKEYLVDRINKAKLDPLPMYEKIDIILTREEKPVPEKEDEETDEHYRQRLIEHVKRELPLQRGQPDRAAPVNQQDLQPLVVVDEEAD